MHPISCEIEDLLAQIAREVGHLAAVVRRREAGPALERGSQEEWEATTLCASAIEKIYTGCERIMAKFASQLDGVPIKTGDAWHRALLDRMSSPFRGRAAVVSLETYAFLDRMRAFRHRERNTYGFELDTEIVLDRAREIIQAYDAFSSDVRRFLQAAPSSAEIPP